MSGTKRQEPKNEKQRKEPQENGLWKRILTPIDFSAPSEAALLYALALARGAQAEVHVCHIIPIPHILDAFHEPGLTPPENIKSITRKARRRIKEIAAAQDFTRPLHVRVQEGEAAAQIIEMATKLKADLIVIGAHGRQGAKRFFLGSVAEAVIRRATCPVLTLRG